MDLRPMLPADDHPLAVMVNVAWGDPDDRSEAAVARFVPRITHLRETDPAGAFTVAGDDGQVLGGALALVREGVWGLSLLIVRGGQRSKGIGRRLLDATLAYAEGTRGAIILSSTDPRAMRRYARAGFALRPCVDASGIVQRDRLRPASGVRPGTLADVPATAVASRFVRGAAHVDDLPTMLEDPSRALLVHERGFAVHKAGSPQLLAALDEAAARDLLWACLAASPNGGTVSVDFLSAGQDWAVEIALEAGLALTPQGPIFVRGDVGPMAPYLPSGAYL